MSTKQTKKAGKTCKYYDRWQWCEPPLEEGDNGTLVTEYECKIAKGYFVATCDGNKENCSLPDKQNKLKGLTPSRKEQR